nr:hypothetical protein [Tanacetum cinerariifolium]
MLTSVERRITPFLGLTGVKVKGSPTYSSFPTCETPAGQVKLPTAAFMRPPLIVSAGLTYKNMVMVLDIKMDVDFDFIRHWLDACSRHDTNAAAEHEDFMDIDEPSDVATHRPPFSLLEPSGLGINKGVPGGNSDVTPSAPSISDLPDDGIEECRPHPKTKPDIVSEMPCQWSPHVSVSVPYITEAPRSSRSKKLLQQIGAIRGTLFPNYLEFRMTGPEQFTLDQPLRLQDQILNHVSSLETLIKEHNEKAGALITPIRLTFGEEVDGDKGKDKEKGVAEVDDDLKKPYKEVLESPFTRRIIEFSAPSHRMPTNLRIYDGSTDPDDHISHFVGAANQGEWEMPVCCRMFQQTLDGPARRWFDRMPNGCIDSWANLRERFVERFALRRRCSKDPTEVSKIVRRANETLPNFKERWTEEMGYILSRRERGENWMNSPITFPPILSDEVSDEPLIIEAEVEGYLVRRVFVDQDAALQVMFEHCFRNLCPTIQARLTQTHTELVGFSGEQLLPMRKIELEVMFGSEGLSRRTTMRFTVVQASSPYNIILGRTGMRELRAISSTTYAMMKFPTPRGISTLVPDGMRFLNADSWKFSSACRFQLINLLKENKDVFAWQPSDMAGIPRRISQHSLNVNPSIAPMPQKRRVLGPEKSEAVTKEVKEWVKAVRPVRYPTWISNPVLVKKADDTWRMCIDFKNLNSACPKDYYPLPEIDMKIEAVMGSNLPEDGEGHDNGHRGDLRQSEEGQHEAKSKKMLIRSEGMKIPRVHGHLRGNPSQPQENEGSGRYAIPKNPKRDAKPKWEARSVESLLIPISRTGLPFFDTLKNITKENRNDFRWTEAAEQAFQELKNKRSPDGGPRGKQTPIRYVSRTLHEAEKNYAPLEKLALCLLHLSRRLRRYFEAHPIKVITDQPVKQILNKPEASEKLAKYAVDLGAYNITYTPRNSVKGQVLADFPNEVPVETKNLEICILADDKRVEEWTLFTDDSSSLKGAGVGLVLVNPAGTEYTYAVSALKVKVDSKLVACQLNGEFVASSDGMAKYLAKAKELVASFKKFSIENVPRNQNQKADVLSKLASVAFNHLTKEILVEVLSAKSVEAQEVNAIVEEDEDNWMTPIIKCLEEGIWPKDENEARALRMKLSQYVMEQGILFKKSYLAPMLRWILLAIYASRHQRSRGQMRFMPDTWSGTKIPEDKANIHHVAMAILSVGAGYPRSPPGGSGKTEIHYVAIDYFTKWMEAKPLAKITGKEVKKFVWENIVCRFGLPRVIVTDNGTQLVNDPFKGWCEKWKIKQMNTTVVHPQANGLVERANKSLMHSLKARLGRERVGWVDEIPNILWAHRTMLKTRFSLAYGSEAVIPAEIGMPTYRTIQWNEAENEEEMRLNLDLIQERRETTTIREAKYKKKVEQYYNKRARPVSFKVGDFYIVGTKPVD